MPNFRVWFAGNPEEGYAANIEDAEADFGTFETVQASSESAAVFAYNTLVGADPEQGERYFVQRVVLSPIYVADVEPDLSPPVVRAQVAT